MAVLGRLWPRLEIPSTDLTGKTVIITGSERSFNFFFVYDQRL